MCTTRRNDNSSASATRLRAPTLIDLLRTASGKLLKRLQISVRRCISVVLALVLLLSNSMSLAYAQELMKGPAMPPAAMPPHGVRKGPKSVKLFKPPLSFSANPSDLDLSSARVFQEPLEPISASPVPGENHALAQALLSFKARKKPEDASALESFLQQYPRSRWAASLQANLARLKFEQGYLTDALSLLRAAWQSSSHESQLPGKAVADQTIAQLVLLEARLGMLEQLQSDLSEIKSRPLYGSDELMVHDAKDGLDCMLKTPGIAYKCGPFAVSTLHNMINHKTGRDPLVEKMQSTARGTNLAQLKDLSDKLGLNLQLAKRAAGSEFVVPSIMHWKVGQGHFAAITAHKNGRYQVKDGTFGEAGNLWISAAAFESQTDGNFLIPAGALPRGWSALTLAQAQDVWGKGAAGSRNQGKCNGGPQNCISAHCCGGMARASVWSMNATPAIEDVPLSYSPPVGPRIGFLVHNNYEEGNQPTTFTFSNFGSNWSLNLVAYIVFDASQNATVSVPGGGYETYQYAIPDNVSNPYPPDLISQAQLVITGDGVYQRQLPDGSIEVYNQADSTGRVFMTQLIDAQGNSAYIQYDTNFRITSVTDAIGQVSTISYVSNTGGNAGFYKIASISDPFSRSCSFAYDTTTTFLTSITDVIGIVSQFAYDTSTSFITTLTTPYGTTGFYQYVPGAGAVGLKVTLPDGTSSVTENWLNEASFSYFWDREAMQKYPADPGAFNYTHCVTTRWLYSGTALPYVEEPVASIITPPLDAAINYTYANEPGGKFVGTSNKPATITRTIDSQQQTWSYQYNALGKVTQSIDPVGRTFSYFYAANNIDRLEARQTQGTNNDLNGKWEFNNTQHVPNLYIDGSGQQTQYSYNSYGELQTTQDALGNIWTRSYDSNGYLTQIQGPLAGNNDVTTMTYDGYGRLYTLTDSEGYTQTFSYDNANRLTQVSYPDGSTQQYIYSNLDLVMSKDRIGRWTRDTFDSMDQHVTQTDPLGRTTQYTWCACGSPATLTDPNGNVTTWSHDLEGRTVLKTYADGSTWSYAWDAIGRLASRTDALNQTISFVYNLDNSLSQKTYTNAQNPTSNVSLDYDPDYDRLTSAGNGWGTYSYSYNPYITDPFATPTTGGGRLESVTNDVIANSAITYQYDAIGRTTNRSINGSSNSTTWTYDPMSRITQEANPLGNFGYSYVDDTSGSSKGTTRLSSISYPNGQVTNFSWYPTTYDERLRQISNLSPSGATLSQFNYGYNSEGEITQWGQIQNNSSTMYSLGYDLAGQLISAQSGFGTAGPAFQHQFYYGYDPGANRTKVQSCIEQKARIGGTVSAGDVLTVTVQDQALSSGPEAVSYTVQSTDSLSSIAAQLAAAITADTNLQTIGVNAASSAAILSVKSVSSNITTYSPTTSGGATETIIFGATGNFTELATVSGTITSGDSITLTVRDPALAGGSENVVYSVQSSDTLASVATNLAAAINADTNLQSLGVVATVAGTNIAIKSSSTNATTYSVSTNSSATEIIALTIDFNPVETVGIGGSVNSGDALTLNIFDAALSSGSQSIAYTTVSTDTPSSIATALASAINSNSNLQSAGISASSSLNILSISSNSLNLTAYRGSTSSGATELLLLNLPQNGTQTVAIGGSVTNADVLTLTVNDAGLSGGSTFVSYTVQSSDSASSIAANLASAINSNSSLQGINVSASSTGTLLDILSNSINTTSYSSSASSGATETMALGTAIGAQAAFYNNVNELVGLAPGAAVTFQGGPNKAIKSASVSTSVVSIDQAAPNLSTYSTSLSNNATETLSVGTNIDGNVSITVGGTVTAGDALTISVLNASLSDGQEPISYTTLSTDTTSSIASALTSAINSDTYLQSIGLSATASTAVISIAITGTTYTESSTGTTSVTLGFNNNGNTTASLGGTPASSNVISVTVHNPALSGGQETASYTLTGTDTLVTAAAGLASAINADAHLQSLGVTASNSTSAALAFSQRFTAQPALATGANSANVIATDGGNNTKTNSYAETLNSGSSTSLTFDANGNLTSDGTNTYSYDAENRLLSIVYPGSGNHSDFTYDPLGRRAKILEYTASSLTSTKQLIWSFGSTPRESRDGSSTIVSQYFKLGQMDSSSKRFYNLNQIDSTTEVTDNSGAVLAQFSYSPFGQQSQLQGSYVPDFGFAGYYLHARSGLNLSRTRAYSANLGRFINRDPINETGGTNLYAYVFNDPEILVDPSGMAGLTINSPTCAVVCILVLAPILKSVPLAGLICDKLCNPTSVCPGPNPTETPPDFPPPPEYPPAYTGGPLDRWFHGLRNYWNIFDTARWKTTDNPDAFGLPPFPYIDVPQAPPFPYPEPDPTPIKPREFDPKDEPEKPTPIQT